MTQQPQPGYIPGMIRPRSRVPLIVGAVWTALAMLGTMCLSGLTLGLTLAYTGFSGDGKDAGLIVGGVVPLTLLALIGLVLAVIVAVKVGRPRGAGLLWSLVAVTVLVMLFMPVLGYGYTPAGDRSAGTIIFSLLGSLLVWIVPLVLTIIGGLSVLSDPARCGTTRAEPVSMVPPPR